MTVTKFSSQLFRNVIFVANFLERTMQIANANACSSQFNACNFTKREKQGLTGEGFVFFVVTFCNVIGAPPGPPILTPFSKIEVFVSFLPLAMKRSW